MTYIIGLTGNIGTGKSTVAGLLGELGAEAIDADRVAHELMEPGHWWERYLVARFGREVLNADGTIDRKRLGAQVFADPAALGDLEKILHPNVRPRIRARFAAATRPVVLVEAIKLLEAGLHLECDAVRVVTASRDADRPVYGDAGAERGGGGAAGGREAAAGREGGACGCGDRERWRPGGDAGAGGGGLGGDLGGGGAAAAG